MNNEHPSSVSNGCRTCQARLLVDGIKVAHGKYDTIVGLFDDLIGLKSSAIVEKILGRPVADGELVSIELHGATARAGRIGQAASVAEFAIATHGVVGTDAAGKVHYYTGCAGEAMLSDSIEAMFVGWTFNGALTKAATLNRVNGPILGLTFGACHMPAPQLELSQEAS